MKLFGRILAAAAASLMILSFPAAAAAEGENVIEAYRISSRLGTVYYSDSYFDEPGTTLNEHLRTLSFAIAATVSDSPGDAGSAYEILRNSGFDMDELAAEGVDDNSDPNGIGTLITHKKAGDKEIIAVAIRSSQYGAEWASNFTVGTEGDAKGFKDSADIVVQRLKSYEEKYGLKGSAVWLTGYSRGGGVSDQIGKYINEHLSEFGIGAEGLYIYTFAAPRTSQTKTEYANIHDFYDINDPVAYVAPESWGFYRTGTETVDDCGDNRVQMKRISLLSSDKLGDVTEYGTDPVTGEKGEIPVTVETPVFIRTVLDAVCTEVSRDEIASLSPYIAQLLPLYFGNSSDPNMKPLLDKLRGSFDASNFAPVYLWLVSALGDKGSEKYDKAFEKLPEVLERVMENFGIKDMLSKEKRDTVEQCISKVLYQLLPVVKTDILNGTNITATLVGNAEQLLAHHRPENYYEQLTENDSYFTRGVTVKSGSVIYPGEDRTVSDPEQLAAEGLTAEEQEILKNGYDISFFTEYVPHEGITDEETAAVKEAVSEFGEAKSITAIYTRFCRQEGFASKELRETSGEQSITIEVDAPGEQDVKLVRVTGGKAQAVSCEYTSGDGDKGVLKADVSCGLSGGDFYAYVLIDPAKGSGGMTVYILIAAGGAAAAAVIAGVVIAKKKKSSAESPKT